MSYQIQEPRWHWRNTRSGGLSFAIHPVDWALFTAAAEADVYGGNAYLHIGPFTMKVEFSIGNCSVGGLAGWLGLSEWQAYDNATKWEAR